MSNVRVTAVGPDPMDTVGSAETAHPRVNGES